MPLGQKITCRSRRDTFNKEIQERWLQNQKDLSVEDFAQSWNDLCQIQNPYTSYRNDNYKEEENRTQFETDTEEEKMADVSHALIKPKQIRLCRHKLQDRTYLRQRKLKTAPVKDKQPTERDDENSDHEWLQLLEMEKMI